MDFIVISLKQIQHWFLNIIYKYQCKGSKINISQQILLWLENFPWEACLGNDVIPRAIWLGVSLSKGLPSGVVGAVILKRLTSVLLVFLFPSSLAFLIFFFLSLNEQNRKATIGCKLLDFSFPSLSSLTSQPLTFYYDSTR